MTRTPVNSSNVKSIGWDNNTLEVEYHHGGIYHYHDVPAKKHAALLAENTRPGGSVGAHLHQHIKPHHAFTKVKAK